MQTIDVFEPSKVDPLFASAIRNGIRRPPRSFRQWLTEEFVVPDGPRSGERFRFESQPITRLWVDAIDSRKYTEHVYSGPSQSGKSMIGYVAPLLYHCAELAESVVFGVPMEEMAADKWIADIRPVLDASSRLRRLLPKRGPGSAGGQIKDRVVLANSAFLKIATAGGSDQGKAGFTSRVVCITEAARFSRSSKTSTETDPLRQLQARMRAYDVMERVTYIEGTKTIRDEYPWALRENSTKSRIVSPCPHCGAWICPEREQLVGWQNARTEIEAQDKAAWQCPACQESIDDAERYQSLTDAVLLHDGQEISKRGKVSGDPPETRRLWFDYNAWHNVFLSAAAIATDCWAGRLYEPETPAHEASERQLTQFVFGLVYDPPKLIEGEEITADDVAERRIQLPRGVAPADTARLTLGVDVGERMLHWVVLAQRETGAVHVVDYGTQDVDVRSLSLRVAIREAVLELCRSLEAGYVCDGDRGRLPIQIAYVDSGHMPDAIFDAAKANTTNIEILAILGRGETQMTKRRYVHPAKTGNIIRKIDPQGRWHLARVKRAKVDQLTIDVDSLKQLVASTLTVALGAPGSLSLFAGPRTVHRRFSAHLASEQLHLEQIIGQAPRMRWICTGANHYLDALAYALTALLRLGWRPDWIESTGEGNKPGTSEWGDD